LSERERYEVGLLRIGSVYRSLWLRKGWEDWRLSFACYDENILPIARATRAAELRISQRGNMAWADLIYRTKEDLIGDLKRIWRKGCLSPLPAETVLRAKKPEKAHLLGEILLRMIPKKYQGDGAAKILARLLKET
jgi:hypothetical protein